MQTRRQLASAVALLVASGLPEPTWAQSDNSSSIGPGTAIERAIRADESHEFRIRLRAGEFFHTDVDQVGADVLVKVVTPDGATLTEADSPTGTRGAETVSIVATADGEWKLVVVCGGTETETGGAYRLSPAIVRPSTTADRARLDAEIAQNEGLPLFLDSTPEAQRAARSKYESALSNWKVAGDSAWIAATLSVIGSTSLALREFDRSALAFREEIPIRRTIRDADGEALALDNLGVVLGSAGNQRDALVYHERARDRARSAGLAVREAGALSHMASVWATRGQNVKAFALFGPAMPVLAANGDPTLYSAALSEYAGVALAVGERDIASSAYDTLLPMAQSNGLPVLVGTAYLGKGNVLADRGEFEQALVLYQMALASSTTAGDSISMGRALNAIGATYDLLGDKPEAIARFTKALDLFVKSPATTRDQGTVLNNLGLSYLTLSAYTGIPNRASDLQALRCFTAALAQWRASGDRFYQPAALVNLARARIRLGTPRRAFAPLAEALTLSRSLGYSSGEAAALKVQGDAFAALRDWNRSLAAYDEALPLARRGWFDGGERTVFFGMARSELGRGNLGGARKRIEEAIAVVESRRSRLESRELRASFFAEAQGYYEFYIDLLMQAHAKAPSSGFDAEALRISERARARSLLDLLQASGADQGAIADPALAARKRSVEDRLDAATRRQFAASATDPAAAAAARKDIDALAREYEQLLDAVNASDPRFASLTSAEPLTVAEIQNQVLDEDTILVQYALGEKRSYAWVVSPTSVRSFKLGPRASIESAALELNQLAMAPPPSATTRGLGLPRVRVSDVSARSRARADRPFVEAGLRLNRMILDPLAASLHSKRLLVVADGGLAYVPFAVLPKPGSSADAYSPLIREREVVNAPSASTVAIVRRERAARPTAAKTLAVIADPVFDPSDDRVKRPHPAVDAKASQDGLRGLGLAHVNAAAKDVGVADAGKTIAIRRLPATRREAESIAKLVPADTSIVALDFSANRSAALRTDLSDYRYVHFATHGFANSVRPELSGLVLSLYDEYGAEQPGFLRLGDVFGMRLGADLVVLSACETGLGKNVRGEGVVGLTRGFMYAGSPRVVVSLWSVSDRATADLMTSFYEGMIEKGMTPSAALRAAQLKLLADERTSAPFYWAPFILQGDWR